MKSFLIAVLIFAVVTACVAINGIYVHNISEKLLDEAKCLPENCSGADPSAAEKLWKENSGLLCISISRIEADAIEDTITEIKCRIKARDEAGYLSARGRLIELCELLHKTEALSLEMIF